MNDLKNCILIENTICLLSCNLGHHKLRELPSGLQAKDKDLVSLFRVLVSSSMKEEIAAQGSADVVVLNDRDDHAWILSSCRQICSQTRENVSITISGPVEKLSDILLGPMSTNNVRAQTPSNPHNAAKGQFVGYCKRTMLHMIYCSHLSLQSSLPSPGVPPLRFSYGLTKVPLIGQCLRILAPLIYDADKFTTFFGNHQGKQCTIAAIRWGLCLEHRLYLKTVTASMGAEGLVRISNLRQSINPLFYVTDLNLEVSGIAFLSQYKNYMKLLISFLIICLIAVFYVYNSVLYTQIILFLHQPQLFSFPATTFSGPNLPSTTTKKRFLTTHLPPQPLTMTHPRSIQKAFLAKEQSEGADARVRRSIGTPQLRNLCPFLLLDHASVAPGAGFPDHPHRGQETITYMLNGAIDHEDFTGNAGTIYTGDLQFMTAGRGIMHSETPRANASGSPNEGLQLWVDLPSHFKFTEPR